MQTQPWLNLFVAHDKFIISLKDKHACHFICCWIIKTVGFNGADVEMLTVSWANSIARASLWRYLPSNQVYAWVDILSRIFYSSSWVKIAEPSLLINYLQFSVWQARRMLHQLTGWSLRRELHKDASVVISFSLSVALLMSFQMNIDST